MATIAQSKTSSTKLFGILRTTLTRARTVSDRRKADAEEWIGQLVATGMTLEANIATANQSVVETTARYATSVRRAFVEVGSWLDRAFTQSGRVRRRAGYKLSIGGGLVYLRNGPATQLPLRLRAMADSFAQTPPTGTSAAEGLEVATGLRAHADVIAAQIADVETAKQRLALLKKAYRTQASLGQRALAGLKKLWLAFDFTEAQVHELIPDAGPRTRGSAGRPTADAGSTTAATANPGSATAATAPVMTLAAPS